MPVSGKEPVEFDGSPLAFCGLIVEFVTVPLELETFAAIDVPLEVEALVAALFIVVVTVVVELLVALLVPVTRLVELLKPVEFDDVAFPVLFDEPLKLGPGTKFAESDDSLFNCRLYSAIVKVLPIAGSEDSTSSR
jgi:hypothetical protein